MLKKKIFIKMVCSSGAAGILLGIFACSPERDEYSFPPMIYNEQAYLREIEAAQDLITLNETRANYAVALKKSTAVEEALNQKWELLTGKIEKEGSIIGKLSNELALWAFDFERIGKERYRVYLLFRVAGKLEDNYGISIVGRLADPSLLPEPDREKGYQLWHIRPLPPTKFWKEGEFIVVREDIDASDLPYELRMNMDTREGLYGKQISLGTMRKIEEMPIGEEEILAENDPFQFTEWLSCCHARSGPKGELVRKRYQEVINGLSSKAVVEDGVEYLGVKLGRTGPKTGRLRLLFRALKPIDRDYWLGLYGVVAPEDIGYLSAARREAGKKSEIWFFPIYPATSGWAVGTPVEIIRDLDVAPISYDIFGYFYNREEKMPGPKFHLGKLEAPTQSPLSGNKTL